MAYADKLFEQRRANLLKSSSSPTPDKVGTSSILSNGTGFVDTSFEERRKKILSQPVQKVSTTPVPGSTPSVVTQTPPPQPSFLQKAQGVGESVLSGLGSFKQEVTKKIQGLFTPTGGKTIELTVPEQPRVTTPELTPEQTQKLATLKVGDTIPGFAPVSGESAQFTAKGKEQVGNVIDNIFTKPASKFLNDSSYYASGIQKQAKEIYDKPLEFLLPVLNEFEKNPETQKKIQANPIYKFSTSTVQGVVQGALRTYANFKPGVQSFLDKEVESVGTKGDASIAGNTIGNIIGTIGSFVLGGEVTKGLGFAKTALPAVFAALGQTSLPSDTPKAARLRNAIIDSVSGTLLETIKPLANIQKMGMVGRGVEYTKQLAKSLGIMSTQTYLDAKSLGANDEQAKEAVKDSALILIGLHGFMIAGKAGEYATRSKFKEGSGVFTPEQARSIVVGSNLEKTKLGETIIKYSFEAESMGKDLKIDMTAAKKSPVGKILNLKTPEGIAITDISYVDSVQQPKIGSADISTEKNTTSPAKVTNVPTETLAKLDKAVADYRMDQGVNISPDGKVNQTATLTELAKLSGQPDVIAKTQEQVKQLPVDANGEITLYRVGTVRPEDNRLISASFDKQAAETFKQNFAGSFGVDRPITEIKVKPEDIKIFMGGDEKEVLVLNGQAPLTPVEQQQAKKAEISNQLRSDILNGEKEDLRLDIPKNIENLSANLPDALPENATGETKVTVYRAGVGPIEHGDFVTLSKANAEKYLTERKGAEIQTQEVALKDLVTAAQKKEFIYFPKPETTTETKPKEALPSPTQKATPPSKVEPTSSKKEVAPADRGVDLNSKESLLSEATKYESADNFIDALYPEQRPKLFEQTKLADIWKEANKEKILKQSSEVAKERNISLSKSRDNIEKKKSLTLKNDIKLGREKIIKEIEKLDKEFSRISGKDTGFTNSGKITTQNAKAQNALNSIVERKAELNKALQSIKKTPSSQASLGFNPKNLENPFSKEAKVELDKIVKQSDIAKTLSEKLGVPIRRGKFRGKGTIGIYKPGQKVVRLKKGGLQTVFHEVAHFLDDTIGFSKKIIDAERDLLVQEYGDPLKNLDTRQKEAFAEYMRFKMTGQTEKIAQWSPNFDKVFDEAIKKLPDVQAVIETATADFKRWNEQPAVSKVLSQISIGGQAKADLKTRVATKLHEVYTAALDDLHPLDEFSKLAEKNIGKVAAEEDPYILARNLRGWVGKAELFLNKGTFGKNYWSKGENGKTKINYTGKSYSEIMKPVEQSGSLDDFRVYIISQRIVNDLAPRNILTGIDVKDAQKALDELNAKHPEFEAIAKERRDYKDRLLDYAKDNGLVGKEGLTKMRELNKYHVPFYRVMEESGAKFLGKTKVAGNIASPIKKIKGSEREIIDPLESDVKDTYAIINAAERNNIGVAMANISSKNFELGRLFERVVAPMKAVKVGVKEVMDAALKGTGAENLVLPEELADTAVTLFRPTYASGPNMLNVNMGDKQLVFEVDPDLFKSIQGLALEDVGTIMKVLSLPATTLRAGATLSPDFSVRNPLRDQFTAFVYSKYGFTPGVDLVKGMFELFKKGDVYDLWKAGGGEHAMFVSLDREKLQENLQEVLKTPNLKDTVLDFVKNPLKPLQLLSELGEAGTRLGEMRNALEKGATPTEAAFASRNITLDFSRIGTTTRAINAIVPFTNANIQATDMMIRQFKKRPFQTLWKSLLGLTLPSVLLYLANREDPRWKEIPQWQKNLFWIVLTPDHIWRIPKPFELGSLFASIPERILEVIDTKDPELFKEMTKTIADGFTPGWMPAFMIPVIENLANYSFFFDRPIVSRGKENLPAPQQSGPYTTEVTKMLGEALNTSPAKIDNLVNGYFGGLGKYATQGIDSILKGTGIANPPVQPAKKLEDMSVIKAFMIKEPIGGGSESVNRVYNLYGETNQKMNYAKKLVKEGQSQEAVQYIKDNPDAIDSIILTGAIDSFSEMNKAVELVKQSRSLTAEQKRDKIDQVGRLQTELAQKVLLQLKAKKK